MPFPGRNKKTDESPRTFIHGSQIYAVIYRWYPVGRVYAISRREQKDCDRGQ